MKVNTRVICATNRDLQAEVDAGRFRQDLYYRLAVIPIELAPLRDRGEDVVTLADYFLRQLRPSGAKVAGFSDDVIDCFRTYRWPGNTAASVWEASDSQVDGTITCRIFQKRNSRFASLSRTCSPPSAARLSL